MPLIDEQMLEDEKLINMYKKMIKIRYFEDKLFHLFLKGGMPGTMHQYTGQEAIATGVCSNLRRDDFVLSTHRGHGHYIAKGGSINKAMAELFSKRTGICKGFGGSMHLVDVDIGFLGCNPVVGANIPIAAGVGLAINLKKTDQVVSCFFGDGATNTGAFHEGINLAAIWKLPVIFVCENNFYAVSTHVSKVMLAKDIVSRVRAYGIPGVLVDGNDVIEVYRVAHDAVKRARGGDGPTFIECKTYRYRGHSRFEPAKYRPQGELEEWLKKDPILRLKKMLIEAKILTEEDIKRIEREVTNEIEAAVKYATSSPPADPASILQIVYA